EVSFAVHLDHRSQLAVGADVDADNPLSRHPRCGAARLVAQLDPENVLGLGQVALRFGQRLLALHHRRVGFLAQFLHQCRGDFRHKPLHYIFCTKRGLAPPAWSSSVPTHDARARQSDQAACSSSLTSTNSPVAAFTTPCNAWALPSSTASATPRAYRRTARLESSLPGIT